MWHMRYIYKKKIYCTLVSCSADFLLWRQMWHVPPKHLFLYGLYGSISQKTANFMFMSLPCGFNYNSLRLPEMPKKCTNSFRWSVSIRLLGGTEFLCCAHLTALCLREIGSLMNTELGGIWNEVFVYSFKLRTQNFSGEPTENLNTADILNDLWTPYLTGTNQQC
jgi:hypothetical protein